MTTKIEQLINCGNLQEDFGKAKNNYLELFKEILPNKDQFEIELLNLLKNKQYTLFGYLGPFTFVDVSKNNKNSATWIFNDLTLNLLINWFELKLSKLYDIPSDDIEKILYEQLGFDSALLSFDLLETYYEYPDIMMVIGKIYVKNDNFNPEDLKLLVNEILLKD